MPILFLFKLRRTSGQTPYYFPEKFGKLIGVKNRPKANKQEFMLTYEIDEVMTSMVTLQISADDIILIYNRFVQGINQSRQVQFEKVIRIYTSRFLIFNQKWARAFLSIWLVVTSA